MYVVGAVESRNGRNNSKPTFCFTLLIKNDFHRATLLPGVLICLSTSQLIEPSLHQTKTNQSSLSMPPLLFFSFSSWSFIWPSDKITAILSLPRVVQLRQVALSLNFPGEELEQWSPEQCYRSEESTSTQKLKQDSPVPCPSSPSISTDPILHNRSEVKECPQLLKNKRNHQL